MGEDGCVQGRVDDPATQPHVFRIAVSRNVCIIETPESGTYYRTVTCMWKNYWTMHTASVYTSGTCCIYFVYYHNSETVEDFTVRLCNIWLSTKFSISKGEVPHYYLLFTTAILMAILMCHCCPFSWEHENNEIRWIFLFFLVRSTARARIIYTPGQNKFVLFSFVQVHCFLIHFCSHMVFHRTNIWDAPFPCVLLILWSIKNNEKTREKPRRQVIVEEGVVEVGVLRGQRGKVP